ncbi:MAG: PEGA domain-containing protein [Myxococcales bacterium]|nr:PEGA domain-containing protein [Myxococcales bacterium]
MGADATRLKWFLPVLVVGAFLTLGAAWPTHAGAREEAPAESLIKEGLRLRRAGRDIDALEKFQRAYELDPTPRAAAQVGLCLQAIGRWVDADFKLSEALTSAEDPWVKKNAAIIKESIEAVKSHVGRIEVLGSPQGAEVVVAGKTVGRLPLATPVPVDEGLVDVEVRAEGHDTLVRSLEVKGGQYQKAVFRLEPKVAAPPPLTSGDMSAEGGEAPMLTASSQREEGDTPLYKKGWFWGALGAAAVAGIVAAVVLSGGGETKTGPIPVDRMETF